MSSGFGTDVKDQVKRATEIVDLVGSYAQLRRSGSNYVCHCPWHDDQRPSLQVNPARQTWVCWVCNIRGDVFDFVMRKEGVEFFEALKILAERAGIALEMSQRKVVKGSPEDKHTLYSAMLWAVERFHNFLTESNDASAARDYLAERGFSQQTIEQFRIGFAPLKWSWLADQSRHTDYSMEVLAACDLVATSDRGSGYFERFRGRLLFPIFDTMGRPVAMGGRLVPGVELESKAKYVNSRETRLFAKSETLYGLNFVKDAVSKTRCLTVVEGYTDVIACSQAGLTDVVACLGTALNQKHIRVIKRFADRITLVLDGDDAGRKRANEIVDLFVSNDVDLRILTLPDDQDPMDFVTTNGTEVFQDLVSRAADAIEHKISIETAGVDLVRDTHASNAALERLLQTLAKIPKAAGSLKFEQLLNRLSRQFGVDREQLKKRIQSIRSSARNYDQEAPAQPATFDFAKLLPREKEVVQILLHEPEQLDMLVENISPEQFVEGPLKELYMQIDERFQCGDEVSLEKLLLNVELPALKNLLLYLDDEWHQMQATGNQEFYQAIEKRVADVLDCFRAIEMDNGCRTKISELQQNQLDEKEEITTLEDLLNQTRQRQGL